MVFERRLRWWVIAKRCASSRTRCSRYRLSLVRAMMTGSAWPGQPHLLQPLRQPDDGHVVDAELVEGALRGRDLRRSAVDDDEAGRVGELAGPPGLGVDQRRAVRRLVDTEVRLRGLRPVVEEPLEPPADRLVHGRDVVLAVERP